MGCDPRGRPLQRFEEDQAAHARRQRQGRHHGADHQFLHPSAASTGCPVDPLPGFRARLALPVFRRVRRRGRTLLRRSLNPRWRPSARPYAPAESARTGTGYQTLINDALAQHIGTAVKPMTADQVRSDEEPIGSSWTLVRTHSVIALWRTRKILGSSII